MTAATADRHNFGQHVKPMDGASGFGAPSDAPVYFQKPRTVFWEWLFFGTSSPLQPLFAVSGANSGLLLGGGLFNLDVSLHSEWLGTSREVIAVSNASSKGSLQDFARFGILLGYAYVFGIRDLHLSNVIRTTTGLQVIDAEVVLTDLILPHETLLMPFKDVTWKDCGLSLLAETPESITSDEAHAVLAGYVDVLTVIDQRRDEILAIFDALELNSPVRIILRNTREYTSLLSERAFESLLDGERVQMEREDIPYFFKRLNSGEVFWVSGVSPEHGHEFAVLSASDSYAADIARHAVKPEQLLKSETEDRLETRLLRGTAFLRKHLGSSGKFQWRGRELSVKTAPREFLGSRDRVDALTCRHVAR